MKTLKPYVLLEDVECIRETDAALLCVIDGAEHWLPRSQLHDQSEIQREGDSGSITITAWLAETKGLEGEEVED